MYCVIGINPSTADEQQDDPTIRRVVGFGVRLGFGGALMLNVGAYRATDPSNWKAATDPIGPENTIEHLKKYVDQFRVQTVVAAWGKNGVAHPTTCRSIVQAFPGIKCWGKNSDGSPRHPLMLPYETHLVPFVNSETS
jgi:hypothetical protein